MRRLGYKRDDNDYGIIWILYQAFFVALTASILMLPFIVWGQIGSLEETWTDFSPQEELDYIERNDEEEKLDKEKYRVYFEDKELVIMVLGGIEWWNKNCGTLSGTGEYFMTLAMEKHGINIDELTDDMTFQTGHFAAALYNDCDVFLEQTGTIGLDMMLMKTPQEITLDTVPEVSI